MVHNHFILRFWKAETICEMAKLNEGIQSWLLGDKFQPRIS